MEIICVPAIVAVVYVLIEAYKKLIAKGREKWLNFIPLIATVLGGVLGVVLFFVAPQVIIANNVWIALVVGLCSGLSSTGANQIFKQLEKFGITVKEVEKKDDDE
jgi:hypothetical protein